MAKTRKKRATPARRPISADDLVRLQWISDPQISPDGRQILFVRKTVGENNAYVRQLWLTGVDGAAPRAFTTSDADRHPRWSPDGRTIAFISGRDKHRPQIWTIPAAGGEATALTALPEGAVGELGWSPDGKRLALSFRPRATEQTRAAIAEREQKGLSTPPMVIDDWWYRLDGDGYFGAERFAVYVVDVDSGEHRKVFARDMTGQMSFDFSPDGRELVIAANTDRRALIHPWKAQLFTLNLASGKLRTIPGLPIGPKTAVRWSPDGKHIAYASRATRSDAYDPANLELWVCDPRKGDARSLTDREDHCLMAAAISDCAEVDFAPRLIWSRDSRRILMRLGWHGETHIGSVAVSGGKIVIHTSGERAYDLGSLSADGKTIALVMATPTTLAEVQVSQLGSGPIESRAVTDLNRAVLSELTLSRPKAHWIDSTDGARVQLWSLLPPGYESGRKKLPAILEVHGGPHTQYGVGFFHELQLLAASGYAVFFSNPRGSKGYGADHCAAIRGNWGTADWDDVQAVTRFMQRHDAVDSTRIGIMGGSYGGYMTNWAIGHSRDYKAAITDRCVSNLVSMVGSSDVLEEPGQYFPGNAWDRPEDLWRQSPLAYFGKVKTPTLIIHSEGDLRCNIEQAEQVFSALKLRNIPTRFVRYPASTSHGMSRGGPPDMRLHRLNQILDWWKRWL